MTSQDQLNMREETKGVSSWRRLLVCLLELLSSLFYRRIIYEKYWKDSWCSEVHPGTWVSSGNVDLDLLFIARSYPHYDSKTINLSSRKRPSCSPRPMSSKCAVLYIL